MSSLVVRLLFGLVLATGVLLAVAGARGVGLALPRPTRSPSRDEVAVVEALAVFAEQLRDTMAGARGLEQALVVVAETAPAQIRPMARRLAAAVGIGSLTDALRDFADEVEHPLCDFVVAALISSVDNQVRDLGSLLGHLAECCRDEVRMRTRVWVARARLRSAVRIIIAVVISFTGGLMVLDRQYMAPYASATGIVVLGLVSTVFVWSIVLMGRMGRIDMPSRFISRRVPA